MVIKIIILLILFAFNNILLANETSNNEEVQADYETIYYSINDYTLKNFKTSYGLIELNTQKDKFNYKEQLSKYLINKTKEQEKYFLDDTYIKLFNLTGKHVDYFNKMKSYKLKNKVIDFSKIDCKALENKEFDEKNIDFILCPIKSADLDPKILAFIDSVANVSYDILNGSVENSMQTAIGFLALCNYNIVNEYSSLFYVNYEYNKKFGVCLGTTSDNTTYDEYIKNSDKYDMMSLDYVVRWIYGLAYDMRNVDKIYKVSLLNDYILHKNEFGEIYMVISYSIIVNKDKTYIPYDFIIYGVNSNYP